MFSLRKALLWFLCIPALSLSAQSLEELLDAGALQARIVLKTEPPLYQKAPILLTVEAGSATRFARSTKVESFRIPGAVVTPISSFAFSETRRIGDQSWAFQSWRFQVNAERSGELQIPPIQISMAVEGEGGVVIEGQLNLEIPPQRIEIPPGTEQLETWLAANSFSVEERWEGLLEEYEVGDAVTRIRSFQISGAPAMAIPASPSLQLKGLDIYEAPALLDDKVVGVKSQGSREERVVFTLQTSDSFLIPGESLTWFNASTGKLEQIDLPEQELKGSGARANRSGKTDSSPSTNTSAWLWLFAIPGLAFLIVVLRGIWQLRRIQALRKRIRQRQLEQKAKREYLRAAKEKNLSRCLELLYQRLADQGIWQLSELSESRPELQRISTQLLAAASQGKAGPELRALEQLWNASRSHPDSSRHRPPSLKLNPET